jgi:hypothetical protein
MNLLRALLLGFVPMPDEQQASVSQSFDNLRRVGRTTDGRLEVSILG